MSDEFNEDDQQQPHIPAELREAAERGKQATAENRKLKLENLLIKTGVDTDSQIGAMLLRDLVAREVDPGKVTREEIEAEANAVGAIRQPEPAPTAAEPPSAPVIGDDERQSTAERASLATAAVAPTGLDTEPDPGEAGLAAFNERVRRGDTDERASAEFFTRKFAAAANGDPRAIFSKERWQARAEEYGD